MDDPITLRIVTVTNNIQDYPEHEKDTREFPHLVEYVEDEADTFVVDPDNPTEQVWPAREFFDMVLVTQIIVSKAELRT